jgi:uncharacterized membrane protein YgdD (TMEM256/DUF423 family)
MLSKQWVMIGAISGFFAVALGAFGAHGLKDRLSEKALSIYQTAVQYQMVHALALIALGLWASQNINQETQLVGWAFTIGIMVFSGSLYALAVTDLKFLGAITPIGGVSFLVGWIAFAFLAWKA